MATDGEFDLGRMLAAVTEASQTCQSDASKVFLNDGSRLP